MRFTQLTSLVLLAGAIVVPVNTTVNPQKGNGKSQVIPVADGMPLPLPPLPPGGGQRWLLANGMPLPLPPIPPSGDAGGLLVADGMPLPLPPLPPGGGTAALA